MFAREGNKEKEGREEQGWEGEKKRGKIELKDVEE